MASKRKADKEMAQSPKRPITTVQKGTASVREFLSDLTLGEFLKIRPPRQVVSFDVDTTIGDALIQLQKCNILSAPLFDTTKNEYYGFVDRLDILHQVLKCMDLQRRQPEELTYHLKKLGEQIQTETLSVFTSLEDGELIYKANESHSLYQVVRYGFSRTHGKRNKAVCHRVAVFDFRNYPRSASSETLNEVDQKQLTETSEVCTEVNVEVTEPMNVLNIISQSDILRFLHKNKNLFKDLLSLSVKDLHLGEQPVVCVPTDMTAVHAFASMWAFDVSSVGVVDHRHGGILVANLSASDLRGIHTTQFPTLAFPVLAFLQKKHAIVGHASNEGETILDDWGLSGDEVKGFPIVDAIYPECSLGKAIEHIVSTSHHRVYVVDHDGRPQGIITITDILRLFL